MLKVNDENSRIRIQDPNPFVRSMDPRIRIRIHPKMSWIRNTGFLYPLLTRSHLWTAQILKHASQLCLTYSKKTGSTLPQICKILTKLFCHFRQKPQAGAMITESDQCCGNDNFIRVIFIVDCCIVLNFIRKVLKVSRYRYRYPCYVGTFRKINLFTWASRKGQILTPDPEWIIKWLGWDPK